MEFGSGPETLLLLHGLSGSARWWSRNVGRLSQGARVLVPDLVGFGRTGRSRRLPSIDETADLLAAWLSALGVERTHLAGHSMGGQIAIHFAVRFPERLSRLVLADAAGLRRRHTPSTLARFALEAAPVWKWGDPRFFPTIVADAVTAGPRVLVTALSHILHDDVRPLLSRVEAPTLVIWGEHDHLVPLEDAAVLREEIPRARLAVLRGAGHNPMIDRPSDFDRLVLRFLDGEDVGR